MHSTRNNFPTDLILSPSIYSQSLIGFTSTSDPVNFVDGEIPIYHIPRHIYVIDNGLCLQHATHRLLFKTLLELIFWKIRNSESIKDIFLISPSSAGSWTRHNSNMGVYQSSYITFHQYQRSVTFDHDICWSYINWYKKTLLTSIPIIAITYRYR